MRESADRGKGVPRTSPHRRWSSRMQRSRTGFCNATRSLRPAWTSVCRTRSPALPLPAPCH